MKSDFMPQDIFIAATGQNVGKTTICLGILAALHKRYSKVGFMKPIGQQHINISNQWNVDKDVVLFKEYFDLQSEYLDMSPVILPAGFTRDFLDGKESPLDIEQSIKSSFDKISRNHFVTIVEGTGHVGVGSIVHMSNARVASLLNLDMIIIASGGLGSAIDELSLNVALCKLHGVKIRGIILNRVLEDKREMIENYLPKALKMWNIPLIGCIPYNSLLGAPTLRDYEVLFKSDLIAGHKHLNCHFQNPKLVAGSLESYQDEIGAGELIITPASREDIINETIRRKRHAEDIGDEYPIHGIIMTGQHPPSESILSNLKKVDMPALYAPLCSYDAMKSITSFIAKIRVEDTSKIEKAIDLVEKNIDMDRLLREC